MDWFDNLKKRFSEAVPEVEGLAGPVTANFTPRAAQVLVLARNEADRLNHHFLGTEHVLLGLIKLGQGVAVNVLQKLGLDLETVRGEVERQVGTGPEQAEVRNIPYTPRVKKVIALAQQEAKQLHHTYVGTEHILLGLLREGDGVAARVLRALDVDIERARSEILRELDPNFDSQQKPSDESPATTARSPASPGPEPKAETVSIDISKHYDVYYAAGNSQPEVYRNVLFKRIKCLFKAHSYDSTSYFIELEQSNGQTAFVARSCIIKFCEAEKT